MRTFLIKLITNNIGKIVLIIGILITGSSAIHGWLYPKTIVQKKYIRVEVPKVITRIKKIQVPIKSIQTIPKSKLPSNISLPPSTPPDAQVLTLGTLAPYEGKTSVISLLNTSTGEGSLISKRLPLPFFQFLSNKELGFRYNYWNSSSNLDLYGRWTFLRIGRIYSALYFEASNKNQKAMIDISYRW